MAEVHPSPNITHRDLAEILDFHKLEIEDFKNKTILDLGCGNSDLAGDLAAKGVPATVIGIDINHRLFLPGLDKSPLRHPVVASLDALPIPSGSIDVVLATFSLPFWAISRSAIKAFFSEAQRVTAKGGIFSVYPMQPNSDTPEWPGLYINARTSARDIEQSGDWERSRNRDSDAFTVTRVN